MATATSMRPVAAMATRKCGGSRTAAREHLPTTSLLATRKHTTSAPRIWTGTVTSICSSQAAGAKMSPGTRPRRNDSWHMRSIVQLILAGVLPIATAHAQTLARVAGGGTQVSGDATNCRVHAPFGIDFDRAGNGYIVEMAGGERVLKVDTAGKLSVFAGTGEKGDSGDGGPALGARFNGMHSLAIGPGGDIFIADTWNSRVRRIDAKTQNIFAFAGTGKRGFRGDGGPARDAEFGN